MAYEKITFTPSGASSEPKTTFIEDGTTLEEYLFDIEGLSSLKSVDVKVNGAPADLDQVLETGDAVTLQPKKTDSGHRA